MSRGRHQRADEFCRAWGLPGFAPGVGIAGGGAASRSGGGAARRLDRELQTGKLCPGPVSRACVPGLCPGSIGQRQGRQTVMAPAKEIIGGDLIIGGRKLSLSKAVRAGGFVFLTG